MKKTCMEIHVSGVRYPSLYLKGVVKSGLVRLGVEYIAYSNTIRFVLRPRWDNSILLGPARIGVRVL